MFHSIEYPLYTINFPKYWLVRDESKEKIYSSSQDEISDHKSMLFHVYAGDYITTLATILRFFQETIQDEKTPEHMRELQLKTIKGVISDLLYLNKTHTIVPKDKQRQE